MLSATVGILGGMTQHFWLNMNTNASMLALLRNMHITDLPIPRLLSEVSFEDIRLPLEISPPLASVGFLGWFSFFASFFNSYKKQKIFVLHWNLYKWSL